jgi:hypothetical protein
MKLLITAGTIGARVTKDINVYVLSNNHVLANINQAKINDPILQPGAYDGGTLGDAIATLTDFQEITFCDSFSALLSAAQRPIPWMRPSPFQWVKRFLTC